MDLKNSIPFFLFGMGDRIMKNCFGWIQRRLKEKEDFEWETSDYPYLEAAKLHYDGVKCPVLEVKYPLTWEKNGSQANYNGNLPFFRKMCQERLCAPHTWHAAEMYLWMEEI